MPLLRCQRRSESDPYPESIQDRQDFSNLAGFLAVFQIADETNSRSGSHGKILLCYTQFLTGVADQLSELWGSAPGRWLQNITVQEYYSAKKRLRG